MDWNRRKNVGTVFILTILMWPIKEMGRSDHLLQHSDADAKIRLGLWN